MNTLMEPQLDQIRVLYIEGFSPGPGLPNPLLQQAGCFKLITARMPYQLGDHATNPYLLLMFIIGASSIYAVSDEIYGKPSHAWYRVIAVLVGGILACFVLKRLAVGYCLDSCVSAFATKINTHDPDLVIGYSWGGGIACGLLNRGLWGGATILIAPAGEQMWLHSGRKPPSLKEGTIPASAAVVTLQGDVDSIVSLAETERLHAGASEAQCQLYVAQTEDHFLEYTATAQALERWARMLCARSRKEGALSDSRASR